MYQQSWQGSLGLSASALLLYFLLLLLLLLLLLPLLLSLMKPSALIGACFLQALCGLVVT
jgi:hypothetical protein